MSQKEVQRVKVIENAAGGRLSVREAPRLLQLSERQVQRLKTSVLYRRRVFTNELRRARFSARVR